MGLFGKAAQVKTTVKPSWQVEQILKDVANRSQQQADQTQFTNHEMAQMSPEYRGALNELANSDQLRQASSLLQGQTSQGLSNLSASNQAYRDILNNPVTARQAQTYAKGMTGAGSLSGASIGQGTNAAGAVKTLGGSAALRSAGRFNTGNINATMANTRGQQMTGQGIRNALANQAYTQDVSGMQARLGGTNLNLGQQGVGMNQQAIQNQLGAGNTLQQYQQAQNQNTWQNSMGRQMFDWDRVNNQLNVLNQISPMAGYTTKGSTAAPSIGSQLYGAGLSGLGIAGKLGAFSSFGAKQQVDQVGTGANAIPVYKYTNPLYNEGGTGVFNGLGSTVSNWMGGSQ